MLVGITDMFDKLMSIDDNEPNSYDCFHFIDETYECFRTYYDKFAEHNKVTLYKKGGVCDRECKEEEGEEV